MRSTATFHDALIGMSRHTLLQSMWQMVAMKVRQVMALVNRRNTDLTQIARNHLPLLDAMEASDVERASEYLRGAYRLGRRSDRGRLGGTMMKRVIVTGANGFVGCNIVAAFLEAGWVVNAVDRVFENPAYSHLSAERLRLIESDCANLPPTRC